MLERVTLVSVTLGWIVNGGEREVRKAVECSLAWDGARRRMRKMMRCKRRIR